MADMNKEILNTLKMIELHTKASAGASSKVIAQGRNDLGNESKSTGPDKIGKSAEGLIVTYRKLQKAIKDEAKQREQSSKIIASQNLKHRKTNQALEDLRKNVERQIGEGNTASKIHRKLNRELDDLGDIGAKLKTSFGMITDQNKGEFLKAIDNASNELNSLANNARALQAQEERNLKERQEAHQRNQEEFWKSFKKGMSVTMANLTAKASQASLGIQQTGFGYSGAGQNAGILDTIGGMFGASVEAFKTGASVQDAQYFAQTNKDALTAAATFAKGSQTSMLTAQEGVAAVSAYGEELNTMFGLSGQAQLQAIGQSLNTLGNLGIKPTVANLQEFGKGVEDVVANSNMLATEVFAEFASLAEDSDFQAFFLSLDVGTNAAAYLSESFLGLREAVGMNMKEFMEYQRFLAKQRSRTGSTRVVQAAYMGQLGAALGLSGKQTALLQQGTAYRESLSGAQADEFDALLATVGKQAVNIRGEAARRGDTGTLQLIDLLMKGGALPEQAGLAAREGAEITQAAQAAVGERSAKGTEKLVDLNSDIREILDGIANSFFGGVGGLASAAFWVQMSSAVAAGTAAGNATSGMLSIANVAKWAGGATIAAGIGFALGSLLNMGLEKWGAWITGDEDWSLGKSIANVTGAGTMSERDRAIAAAEDQMIQRQQAMAAEYQENKQRMELAQIEGNVDLVKELKASNELLRKQYDEMVESGKERILQMEAVGTHKRGGGRKGN